MRAHLVWRCSDEKMNSIEFYINLFTEILLLTLALTLKPASDFIWECSRRSIKVDNNFQQKNWRVHLIVSDLFSFYAIIPKNFDFLFSFKTFPSSSPERWEKFLHNKKQTIWRKLPSLIIHNVNILNWTFWIWR